MKCIIMLWPTYDYRWSIFQLVYGVACAIDETESSCFVSLKYDCGIMLSYTADDPPGLTILTVLRTSRAACSRRHSALCAGQAALAHAVPQ